MIDVRLDWRAYWERFKDIHGRDPIPYHGLLLFPDGWRYGTDYGGPEVPPKDEREVTKLGIVYWTLRKRQVVAELRQLEITWRNLNELQSSRSAPIQRIPTWKDERGFWHRGKPEDLQIDDVESRLKWLRADAVDCERRVEELRKLVGAEHETALLGGG